MKQLDLAIGWIFVAIGTVHNFFGVAMRHVQLNTATLWFIAGGIMLWLLGAMNLLRVYYGEVAPGLRRVCLAANLVGTAFAVTYTAVTRSWSSPRSVLILAICAGAVGMAIWHRPTSSATK